MKAINLTVNILFVGMVVVAIAFAFYKLFSGAPICSYTAIG
jgi:hypothetical protein